MEQLAPADFTGIDHHSMYSANIEKSKFFYQTVLGLELDPNRPKTLPFDGAWFKLGKNGQSLHCLCLPNPDPVANRPEHGGLDRHVAIRTPDLDPLIARLEHYGIFYSKSKSGRRAIFFRDPDANAIEVIEVEQK